MVYRNRNRNDRNGSTQPKIRDEAYSWLAQRCSDSQWDRILDLRQISAGAVLDFVKNLLVNDPTVYREFEEANLTPETIAARRKAEAERIQAEETAKRSIDAKPVPPPTVKEIVSGRGAWTTIQRAAEEEAAAKKEREEGFNTIPDPDYDTD